MSRDLVSLKEHNESIISMYEESCVGIPFPNGIKCPDCEAELLDSSRLITFLEMGNPYTRIQCNECGFLGQRIVIIR